MARAAIDPHDGLPPKGSQPESTDRIDDRRCAPYTKPCCCVTSGQALLDNLGQRGVNGENARSEFLDGVVKPRASARPLIMSLGPDTVMA